MSSVAHLPNELIFKILDFVELSPCGSAENSSLLVVNSTVNDLIEERLYQNVVLSNIEQVKCFSTMLNTVSRRETQSLVHKLYLLTDSTTSGLEDLLERCPNLTELVVHGCWLKLDAPERIRHYPHHSSLRKVGILDAGQSLAYMSPGPAALITHFFLSESNDSITDDIQCDAVKNFTSLQHLRMKLTKTTDNLLRIGVFKQLLTSPSSEDDSVAISLLPALRSVAFVQPREGSKVTLRQIEEFFATSLGEAVVDSSAWENPNDGHAWAAVENNDLVIRMTFPGPRSYAQVGLQDQATILPGASQP